MALTAAEIQARITALRKARDSGVLQVAHNGTTTTFRDLESLNAILAALEAELAGTRRKRVSYIQQNSKGL